jgi:hypothetical protein
MPPVLPPRRAIASKQNPDFSPLLGIIAALPALLTVVPVGNQIRTY